MTTEGTSPSDPQPDRLVPDPVVWREFGITAMTGWRWTHDPNLNFPPPIKIRNRCFRSRRLIEEFKARMMGCAIRQSAEPRGRRQNAPHLRGDRNDHSGLRCG